jgi:predicted nucleic acid-binding Zn ribbon protein
VTREPIPISESLNSVIRSLRNDSPSSASPNHAAGKTASQMASQMGSVFGRWTEAVGDAVAAHVTPLKLDGSTLIVEVDDPAWATQLRFLETALKQRLLEVAGAKIETIEARVRRF